MHLLLRWAGAIALALMPSLAFAQAPLGKSIQAPAGYVPATAIYCDDGTGKATLCSFGSGGGGGGSSAVFSRDPYIATANGTGFNSGDHLAKITAATAAGGSPTTFWVNDTQGTVIGSPPLSSISQLPQVIANTAFGSTCLVVTGNQSYAVGSQQLCNMTPTGRLKVGVSAATNIAPALIPGTTLEADLIACIYRATPPTWSDQWTGAIACNAKGAMFVDGSGVKQPTSVADGDNATMGSKADAACTTNDTTPCSAIALWKELVAQYAKVLNAYTAAGTTGTTGLGVQGMSGGVPLTVSGQVADGNAPGVYSLPAAGIDAGGLKRTFRTDANGNMQVGGIASNVVQVASSTDRGASIGTTATTLMAANPSRRGWSVQNQSSSASCYVNGTAGATTDYHSLAVPAGQYFEPDHHVATGAISIVCTAANTPVYSREW